MDVKDQSYKIDQARDRYREAQEDLRASYEKNLSQMKNTYDLKSDKQEKNYSQHKTKLEEQNQINNELYSDKTKSAISRAQEDFKNRIKENSARFEQERNQTKNELNDKLSSISDSYKKSFDENNRYQDQVKKSMSEKYQNANKNYQNDFNNQVADLTEKSQKKENENRDFDRKERISLAHKHSGDLENLRSTSSEQKFKEISRLKNDTENLRTTFERDNQLLRDRQEERVSDLLSLKSKENEEGQKNYEELQRNIRQRNVQDQEKQSLAHKTESKELEKRFNNDVRNIQRVADQKIKGGTPADTLKDELKQTKNSYDNRLQAAREEIARTNKLSNEKEEKIDSSFREKLKEIKQTSVENLAKHEAVSNETLKQTIYKNKEKNNTIVDRYKTDSANQKRESEDRLSQVEEQGQSKAKEQRIEFSRVVNSMNEKNMETINSLKEDYSKDKTHSIEKSKKDFNDEKVALKNEFIRQGTMKDALYEQKLAEMERQTNKIIENYENRMSQIARKAELEVTTTKNLEEQRKIKEDQATKLALETIQKQNENETALLRDKFERMIARDQVVNEQKSTKLVQKYEDLLARERNDHQKELSTRLGEAQAQFERLYKSSELEKETLRNQYEQRMENMKLAELAKDNSKKV